MAGVRAVASPAVRPTLIVQGDDFGMCGAVNEGIAIAFSDGILTQASTMVPCPQFDSAMALAAASTMPVGMHSTLTCEWDNLRWGPLTRGASLVGNDGTFHRTVEGARSSLDPDEASAELVAQAERMFESGNDISYFDAHMGLSCIAAYESVCARYSRPFLYPGLDSSLSFASVRMLSERPAESKKAYLLRVLEKVAASSSDDGGVHLLVTHPGVDGEELASITSPSSPVYPWARDYRVSDLEVLCDPEVIERVEELEISLSDVEHAFP